MLADLSAEHYIWVAEVDRSNPDATRVQEWAHRLLARLSTFFDEAQILTVPDSYTGMTFELWKTTHCYQMGSGCPDHRQRGLEQGPACPRHCPPGLGPREGRSGEEIPAIPCGAFMAPRVAIGCISPRRRRGEQGRGNFQSERHVQGVRFAMASGDSRVVEVVTRR